MAFDDRYAITSFKHNDYRISFSIDENPLDDISIIPVLLVVPKMDKAEHEHIMFNNIKDLKILHSLLALKGTRYLNLEFNRIEIDENYKLTIYELYNKQLTELVSVNLTLEIMAGLRDWIDNFCSYTQDELKNKFSSDRKNQGK